MTMYQYPRFTVLTWEPTGECICATQKPEEVWKDRWNKCVKCGAEVAAPSTPEATDAADA